MSQRNSLAYVGVGLREGCFEARGPCFSYFFASLRGSAALSPKRCSQTID
jgi:hypothetical protein